MSATQNVKSYIFTHLYNFLLIEVLPEISLREVELLEYFVKSKVFINLKTIDQ